MIFIDGKGMGSSTPNKHLYMLSNEADIQLIYCYITSSLSLSLSLTGEGSIDIIGSITSATHFHLCIGNFPCDLLCLYNGPWRSQGNILMPLYICVCVCVCVCVFS